MEECYNSILNNNVMDSFPSFPQQGKSGCQIGHLEMINPPLILANNEEQIMMIREVSERQKVAMQNKNYDLDKMYVDQSTQIQNYSNLVSNLSKQSRMADKKTAVPNKSSCMTGQSQQKMSGDHQGKKMFKVKLKGKGQGKRYKQTYDELADKNLIQYLYTRQNKIFQEQEETHSHYQSSLPLRHQPSKIKRNSPQLASVLRFDRHKHNKPITIRKDNGRKEKYTIFDAISCQQSIKQKRDQKYKTIKSNVSVRKVQKQNKNHLTVLKERMEQLQESVYHKVPFLLQMGVKFKYKN